MRSGAWGLLVALAVIFAGLLGRAAIDKILALRAGPESVALCYKQQQRVEEAWRTDDEERFEDAAGVPLGASPHSCTHRHHGSVPVA